MNTKRRAKILKAEIKNISHTHPLKRLNGFGMGVRYCLLCLAEIHGLYYGCSPCGFSLCKNCAKKPLIVDGEKAHVHPLSILPKTYFIFSCDACGEVKETEGQLSLCVCILCSFTIHRSCIKLPPVIYVNRHDDHRISLVCPIGIREGNCGICREKVDGKYGGYSCYTCSFVAHSKCATRSDVWDGIEMEGVPEEDPEEIMPFKVIGEGVIKHCSHEHNLRLILTEDDSYVHVIYKQCSACINQILSGPCFICPHDECDFILHETCANLLKKKRHPSTPYRLSLSFDVETTFTDNNNRCDCCKQDGSAFTYVLQKEDRYSKTFTIDVRCASIKDGHIHASHPHSGLILNNSSQNRLQCSTCSRHFDFTLKCIECESFILCFHCATLPEVVKHKYDEHPLSLQYGENSNSVYWCEICEIKINQHKWFYTCEECNSTFHVFCVIGEDASFRVGFTSKIGDKKFEVIPNNFVSRPHCPGMSPFHTSRCQGPSVFKYEDVFCCSFFCTDTYASRYRETIMSLYKKA